MASQDEELLSNNAAILAGSGRGRKTLRLAAKQAIFAQGDLADSVFYLKEGHAKISVVSQTGKEAIISILSAGDFLGEDALPARDGFRLATAVTLTPCILIRIGREEVIRLMRVEPTFNDLFLGFLLKRSMRVQADLVDQLFNSSEKRLARILLLMANFGEPDEAESSIPKISQESLAEMVGTTRSRVSFFMNRFRKLGYIEYDGQLRVHRSLLNVVLHDRSDDSAQRTASLNMAANS